MLTQQAIIDFCNQYDYDIRKSGNGRWIDQKLTLDVLSFIADCILQFTEDDPSKEFKVKDIWIYKPVGDSVRLIFKKPDVNDPKAAREYDKFFGQPLKLLGYSKVLRVWGDRIFEKCGIRRDEGGDGGKTLEIRGKRRLSARDGGANYQQS